MAEAPAVLAQLGIALREAGTKIGTAVQGLKRREDDATSWMQRFIYREIEQRTRTRGSDHWERLFPGLPAQERAQRRIQRMLTRSTVAGVAAAAGASTAEVISILGEGLSAFGAIPLGLASIGAEALYTTALQIDLAFDLASIYGVPFAHDDVGEISTLLALALGVDLVQEPTRHDKPASAGETKPWRVMRQMRREDFAERVSRSVVQQALLRNAVPVLGVLVSAAWNQIVLRGFAKQVHTAVRQRLAITRACRAVQLGEQHTARLILEGAWLIATADGDINHQESLALAVLIDSLPLPERIAVHEASFPEDEEDWFWRVDALPLAARDVLVDVLSLVASADGAFSTPERRFLKRLSRTLGREIDLAAIEQLVARIRQGEAPARPPEVGVVAAPALLPAS